MDKSKKQKQTVILASNSPRRKDFIKKIKGIEVVVIPPNAKEVFDENASPYTNAVRLATQKAKEVFDRVVMDNIEYKDGICMGCDTIVALDGKIFSKPNTADEAFKMFYLLCGKTHEVITGVCLIPFIKSSKDQYAKTQEKSITQHAFFVSSLVTFFPFNPDIIEPYIASKAPFDKAGGYGLQDTALAPLIKKVTGDRDNVIGFPTKAIEKALEKMEKEH